MKGGEVCTSQFSNLYHRFLKLRRESRGRYAESDGARQSMGISNLLMGLIEPKPQPQLPCLFPVKIKVKKYHE
jgi:hypothetical protein